MLFSSARRIRLAPVLLALLAALMFAPSAFARGHHNNWGVSLGFSGPGYSIGYSDCRNCGRGYVSGNFYGGYSGGYGGYNGGYGGYNGGYGGYYSGYGNYYGSYGGGYYSSSYYPTYYNTYYPSYGAVYYDYPSYRRNYRPVTRRVVRYDNSRYNDYRGRDSYRDDRRDDRRDERRHDSRDYAERDRGYSRRAAYYDRD